MNGRKLVEPVLDVALIFTVFFEVWFLMQHLTGTVPPILPYTLISNSPTTTLTITSVILVLIVAANVASTRTAKSNQKPNLPADTPPQPIPVFPVESYTSPPPTQEAAVNVKRETLDTLLTEIVRRNIENLDVLPEVVLKNSGEYRILGRTWSGQVSIAIKPKQSGDKEKENTVEEEPLF